MVRPPADPVGVVRRKTDILGRWSRRRSCGGTDGVTWRDGRRHLAGWPGVPRRGGRHPWGRTAARRLWPLMAFQPKMRPYGLRSPSLTLQLCYSGAHLHFRLVPYRRRASAMALIVAKFGGTSVALPRAHQKRRQAPGGHAPARGTRWWPWCLHGQDHRRAHGARLRHHDGAPARELDRLLSTGEQVSMTLLAMPIEALGYKSISSPAARRASRPTARTTRRAS